MSSRGYRDSVRQSADDLVGGLCASRRLHRGEGHIMIGKDVTLGEGVVIHHPDLVNLYGCSVGAGSRIGTFVEIQRGAVIGASYKKQSHTFICDDKTNKDETNNNHGKKNTNDL